MSKPSRHPSVTVIVLAAGAALAAPLLPACSSEDATVPMEELLTLTRDCGDTEASLYADPGPLPAEKGAILRCVDDGEVPQDQVQQRANATGYNGPALTSGAHAYRVLYVTERAGGKAGTSTAVVYVPTIPRARDLPAWVNSHGSRGQGGNCAPTKRHPDASYVADDFEALVWPVVGAGYAFIAPDLAGYANYGAAGNPPGGYAFAEDVAKSSLDGARALRKLVKGLGPKLVISGHSQGGHTALSSLAYAEAYAPDAGEIAAVVAYAPLWLSQRTWGAILAVAGDYPIKTSPGPNAVSVWYHYSHAEILDGPGKGELLFKPAARAAIKSFFDGTCWSASYPGLEALGTVSTDLYDADFAAAVGAASAIGVPCPSDPKLAPICELWQARYKADRPTLTGAAAQAPILFLHGLKDATLVPGRAQCAVDALKRDNAKVTYCVDANAEHGGNVGITRLQAGYVNAWVAAKVFGTEEPARCALDETAFKDDKGVPLTCATPPPND